MRSITVLAAILFLVTGTLAAAPSQSPEDQIRAARAAWERAYNAGDIDALMREYTDDAVSMTPGAPASIGIEAIRADIGGFLKENNTRHTTEIQEIIVKDDIAIEYGHYTDEITPKAGGQPRTERGKHVVVFSRGPDGKWRTKWEIWNTNAPN